MDEKKYNPVEDGWRNAVKPCYVSVDDDRFNEGTVVVDLYFNLGEDLERPKATIPLVYGHGHKIVTWDNSAKAEHTATEADQREAFALLARIFPAWGEFCRDNHTVGEKLRWFEEVGREVVLNTVMDIKVGHSSSGFCYARVKDPANSKPKREVATKASTLTRAEAAFAKLFGGARADAEPVASDDGVPF